MQLQQSHHHPNAQPHQNDSWFWEPESSSTSSKKDENGSPDEAEIDLTNIPLDGNDLELMEKLRRQVIDRDAKLKAANAENLILNEKLKLLTAENQELNVNIDELDRQQQIAIEKVLDVKHGLQDKLNAALAELKGFQTQKDELIKSNDAAISLLKTEIDSLTSQLEELNVQNNELTAIAKNYEIQIDELMDANLKQETEIVSLTDTVKSLEDKTSKVAPNNDEILKNILTLINTNFKLNESYESEDQFMDTFTKWIHSTSSKLREIDFEMSKLIDENKQIREDASKYAYERDSLKSELMNYEVECSELMKNNNILMADIENLRLGGKLETIMENDGDDDDDNEEVRQTDDSNQTDYELQSIRQKLEATEIEKTEYVEQIQHLKQQLTENVSRCKSYQQEIDNLENEKCNYLFELNELKSEEERNILQKELKVYKEKEVKLSEKLSDLEKENEILLVKYSAAESMASNQIQDTQHNAEESSKLLNQKQLELDAALHDLERLSILQQEMDRIKNERNELIEQLTSIQENLTTLQHEKEQLEKNCDELRKMHETNLEGLNKSNELVEELQKKILETDCADELKIKIASLEESITAIVNEKENLIGLVTTKHNENVQYHNEIMRLNQAIQQHTDAESNNSMAAEQLNDEIKFLREKCDLLAQNLLSEQNSHRLLQQEKNDAVEMNNTLNKDIERLRQHLLEVADAYTFEQISLQKQVEEYKSKLMAVEADAKKSATAYTSANVRANQQAETLQTQYNLLAQQRDELLAKLGAAEDIDNKNQAALTNLQVALEIFQRGKLTLNFYDIFDLIINVQFR